MSQYNGPNGEDGQLMDGSADEMMGPSDTDDDDDEERLDCVHDIHGDGEEADVEDVENGSDNNLIQESDDHRQ